MPAQTVAFNDKENKMIEYYKTAFGISNKPDAIRKMIVVAFKKHKKEIIDKIDII